jgi:hypothetical protein
MTCTLHKTAAAEIAKILSAPSARDIVLGHHHSSHHSSSPSIATWDSDSDSKDSKDSSSSAANPTPWLKTPSEEGKFTYAHKKLVRLPLHAYPAHTALNESAAASQARTFSACTHRHDYSCNDEDTASQVFSPSLFKMCTSRGRAAPPYSSSPSRREWAPRRCWSR